MKIKTTHRFCRKFLFSVEMDGKPMIPGIVEVEPISLDKSQPVVMRRGLITGGETYPTYHPYEWRDVSRSVQVAIRDTDGSVLRTIDLGRCRLKDYLIGPFENASEEVVMETFVLERV